MTFIFSVGVQNFQAFSIDTDAPAQTVETRGQFSPTSVVYAADCFE